MRPAALRAVPAALIIMVEASPRKKMKGCARPKSKLRLAVDYENDAAAHFFLKKRDFNLN